MKILLLLFLVSLKVEAKLTDNSYFIDEAYNQGKGEYQFTQKYTEGNYAAELEVPITHLVHQTSFLYQNRNNSVLNYKFQSRNKGTSINAHRIGAILPTYNGNAGIDFMEMLTLNPTPRWASHWNLGGRVEEQQHGFEVRAGTSLIYSLGEKLDSMLEAFWRSLDEETEFFINPGMRMEIKINSVEAPVIVPGIAFPISFKDNRQNFGLFLYLSMETI